MLPGAKSIPEWPERMIHRLQRNIRPVLPERLDRPWLRIDKGREIPGLFSRKLRLPVIRTRGHIIKYEPCQSRQSVKARSSIVAVITPQRRIDIDSPILIHHPCSFRTMTELTL